jgi:hypothetical protein
LGGRKNEKSAIVIYKGERFWKRLMIGKKILWFITSTLVSFVVFAIIARGIELGIMKRQADLRLTACEGQSVIAEVERQYENATLTSPDTIEQEARLWQAQGITNYCVEMYEGGALVGSTKFVLLVRNGEIDLSVSNCFATEDRWGDDYLCQRLLEMYEAGYDLISIDAVFDLLRQISNNSNTRITTVFDPTYHLPLYANSYDMTAFDVSSYWEIVAFVPLD